jgi:alkylation response protein AidB-like acyl-CoA dehydrogenase
VRFAVSPELRLFAESVRDAIGGWEGPREPELGTWQDDRDDDLGARLAEAGWMELWSHPELVGAAVAGGIELGRTAAPLSLVDEATLGAPLWVDGRARHGRGAAVLAVPRAGSGLARAAPGARQDREVTIDGSGTVRVDLGATEELTPAEARARWTVWSAATLAYLAGLGAAALELAVEHARAREQFGAPLASLPAVQSLLADAALALDAMSLLAWSSDDRALRAADLLWAGPACCDVTASAIQVHGAIGFALESGLHRFHRRARAASSWAAAACAAAR